MKRLSVLAIVACSAAPPPSAAPAPALVPPQGGAASRCVFVREDPAGIEETFEGTVSLAEGVFVMRLARPRCVTGLGGASVLVEIALASTGFDLRPFVGQSIRVRGEAAPASNALGGAGVVVLVTSVDRLGPLD